jgi:hypothetical protein
MHCQQLNCIIKESTHILSKTTTLHHEGKLGHVIFPYSTSTSALPKTTLHYEENLTHATIQFIFEGKHKNMSISNNHVAS